MEDKKYLFKRNNTWWVKVAVPKSLRNEFGFDLRQTTGESNLEDALKYRDKIVESLKSKFKRDGHELSLSSAKYLEKTDISNPQYFHKVVDCQYA